MATPQPGTWHADPAHFRRPTRRAFLHVGLAGGLGPTLDGFFRLQAAPRFAERRVREVTHSFFLPGGIAHQDTSGPKPLAPIEYVEP